MTLNASHPIIQSPLRATHIKIQEDILRNKIIRRSIQNNTEKERYREIKRHRHTYTQEQDNVIEYSCWCLHSALPLIHPSFIHISLYFHLTFHSSIPLLFTYLLFIHQTYSFIHSFLLQLSKHTSSIHHECFLQMHSFLTTLLFIHPLISSFLHCPSIIQIIILQCDLS